jgi:hypothetical protein
MAPIAASAAASTPPTQPGAVIMGAPLTAPPDVSFGCRALPLPNGESDALPGDSSSCTWSTPANAVDPPEALTTPIGAGTITGVRIRVGALTGPMSLVILESQKNLLTGAVTCCEATLVTQPVMPTPNAVSPFRTNLPVETDAEGESSTSTPGMQVTDMLALAVLNDATPIPAIDETAAEQPPSDVITAPSSFQGHSAPLTETSGYQLDLQATWVPGTPVPATPKVRFASGRIFVSHGYLHVPLRCRYDTCRGTIAVTGGPGGTTYASGPFHIGQNLYRSIAVRLTRAGATAVAAGRRIGVMISVRYETPSSERSVARTVFVRF